MCQLCDAATQYCRVPSLDIDLAQELAFAQQNSAFGRKNETIGGRGNRLSEGRQRLKPGRLYLIGSRYVRWLTQWTFRLILWGLTGATLPNPQGR